MAGIPAPASGREFALDADVWFDALLEDPQKFFARMPVFDGLREAGLGICDALHHRGIAKVHGYGYRVAPDCPHCHMRTVRHRKREWAMRIFYSFLRAWDNPATAQELRNQVALFFLERNPEIIDRKLPIVFIAHTRDRQVRRLAVHEPREDA
jgi:hypothetical protein